MDRVFYTSCSNVDFAHIDFNRAFDSLACSKYLAKSKHFGITDELLNFRSAFLHNRKQFVVSRNIFKHDWRMDDVLQGSVL